MENKAQLKITRPRGVELWISSLLQWGVFFTGFLIAAGWIAQGIQSGGHASFSGTQTLASARIVLPNAEFLSRLLGGDFSVLVSLGVLFLIWLPVVRVGFTILLFLKEKDFLYVGLAAAVLCILFGSIYWGVSAH